ncbi:cysteine desulfurase [Lachnospiraceae bacterium XBB2008]|nr:cysteine desulfurase [Lachnospiraceae bacterium XBB2008]
MMEAYLDNSATTRPYSEVTDAVAKVMYETYGNPSSMHMMGVKAEKYLTEATDILVGTLKCRPSEILYTSGGTESDNTALFGVAHARRRSGRHIITTRIEHPAILEPCACLEKEGYEISYLGTDEYGRIDPDELETLIRPDTILVSIMHTNNEIGALEPLEAAGAVIKKKNPECIFHVDAVQGYAKDTIIPKKLNIDLMSVSAHKFHGPRGVGFLYIKDKTRIDPLIYGGGQQKGMRSGTENVPGIYGMAVAAKKSYEDLEADLRRMYGLKKQFMEELVSIDEVSINGIPGMDPGCVIPAIDAGTEDMADIRKRMGAPHIISASFEGVRSEVLLHALEDKGIYVSAGSACASNRPHVSATLTSIGLRKDLLDSTIRFSMSTFTTREELDYTLEALNDLLPTLRRFTRH